MSTTKKVLVGVGIGCGSLMLLGLIALGVGAWWVKQQVGDSVSSMVEAGQKMQKSTQELAKLDQSYPYTPPAEGEVATIAEARLLKYLAVRELALPVYAEFEKKAEELNDMQDAKAALKATGLVTELLTKVHGAYIEGLKQHKMSPTEFRTITQTLYTSVVAGAVNEAQRLGAEAREQALAEVRRQLENESLPEEERALLEEQELQLLQAEESLVEAQALSEESKVAVAANVALVEKYQERIQTAGNLALDALLFGEGTQGLNTAQDNP
jgi:hypothetical protein